MKKGHVYIILTAFIFSTIEIISKMVALEINPFQMIFLRFSIGGAVLIPFAIRDLKMRKIKLLKEDYRYFVFLAFLSIVVSMSFYQLAIYYTKASTVAIVFSSNAVFTIPFAYFILKEEIDSRTLSSLVLSLMGLVFIFNPFKLSPDFKGILFAVLAAVTFSLYSVVGKKKIDYYGGITFNCITFLIGAASIWVMLLILKLPVIKGVSSQNIVQILYLSIVATCIGYLLYFISIKETSAGTASMVFFIKPALAPILSLIVLNERISFNTLIGMALILTGSYIKLIKTKSLSRA